MAKKNEFERFCDLLENSSNKPNPDNSNGDELKYVRVNLENKSTDYLIQIKAEAEQDDIWAHYSNQIGIFTLIITAATLIETIFTNLQDEIEGEAGIFLIVGIVLSVICILYLTFVFGVVIWEFIKDKRIASVKKWRKYILAVIDDLIEESKKNEQVFEIEVEEISSHKKSTYIGKIQKIK